MVTSGSRDFLDAVNVQPGDLIVSCCRPSYVKLVLSRDGVRAVILMALPFLPREMVVKTVEGYVEGMIVNRETKW